MAGYWRDTSRTPRFFFIDAYAVFPMIIFLIHMRWWTFQLAVSVMLFFAILERFKLTLPIFLRIVRLLIGGPHKTSRVWWRE